MTVIIAGRFQQQEQVQNAIATLEQAGFPPTAISSFYVNPPGQHDAYPIGGDRNDSPGAEQTGSGIAAGVTAGAAVGTAIGAATAPLTGPLGAVAGGAVGAHLGSLVGTLNKLEPDGHGEDENPVPVRSAGMLVAVAVDPAASSDAADTADAAGDTGIGNGGSHKSNDGNAESRAIGILRSLGATELERARGHIVDGDWQDFDPVAPPQLIDGGQP